jgi:SAM-dependent methyltransferase
VSEQVAAADAYVGVDNLEAMQEAVNYNAFLAREVARDALPGRTVVDFGAGVGTFARPLAAAGHRVICVESDDHLTERLRADGLTTVAAIDALPDASVDYLYSLNVLEHIEDDAAVVQAWFQKLKPGAPLLLYVPAFMVLYSEMDRRIGHFRRYRRVPLQQLLERHGFEVNTSLYVDSAGFFASLAFKAIDRSGGVLNPRTVRLYDRVAFPVSRLMDRVVGRWFGKNVLIRATRPA